MSAVLMEKSEDGQTAERRYVGSDMQERDGIVAEDHFLAKPFRVAQLLSAVREAVESPVQNTKGRAS